ncbi:hypothetical protein AN958_07129 [Leucoagaricus sp. SymC.cos]|nr:hypothetical protein AN958_07129 [Leucoagaricus sp. SymC.cos]
MMHMPSSHGHKYIVQACSLEEIVTNNGTAFVAAMDYLKEKYGIRHICISPYNSQSNGTVETTHRTI